MLSWCDTVSCLWGIGKVTVLKVLKSGEKSLSKLGNTEERDDDINFLSAQAANLAGYKWIPMCIARQIGWLIM